jgi:hypothetical protein
LEGKFLLGAHGGDGQSCRVVACRQLEKKSF